MDRLETIIHRVPQRPYYEEPGVVLYHADALDLLPALEADCTITDPPYNVGKRYDLAPDALVDEDYRRWLAALLTACPGESVLYFPGLVNVFTVSQVLARTDLRPYHLLGWHKREFAGDLFTHSPAIAWEPIVWATRVEKPWFTKHFGATGRDFLVVNSIHGDPYKTWHPCPKPLPVLRWLVDLFVPPGGLVVDPCCGTGPTLLAAKEAGCLAIGIDVSTHYLDATIHRLRQTVLPWPRGPVAEQRRLAL